MQRCRDGGGRVLLAVVAPSQQWLHALAASVLVTLMALATQASAQDRSIIRPGSAAVSAFSGTAKGAAAEPGETIDLDGASLRIFDLSSLDGPAAGKPVEARQPFEVLAAQIGQVFGLAYDDGLRDDAPSGTPNLYAGATSLHGIRVVVPGADGVAQALQRGAPGAAFMPGQFGEEAGGGPGAIWRIDGISGAVSKFAEIPNSGPGVADIAFDKAHRQFFASDLDSGLIHRVDASGRLVDSFDHGVAARPKAGLAEVKDDGKTMDISAAGFDSDNPNSWGYTQDARRVWALAVHGERLYYAVGDKADIWSVGIEAPGALGGAARRELEIGAESPVTDMVFDTSGGMYLSSMARSGAAAGRAEVLHFGRDTATRGWKRLPAVVAEGRSGGGIDLHYGYDGSGRIDPEACTATLIATGDAADAGALLLLMPAKPGQASTPARIAIGKGTAGMGATGTAADAAPLADVELWRPCGRQAVAAASAVRAKVEAAAPGISGAPAGGTVVSAGSAAGSATPALLNIRQTGDATCRAGQPCTFEITIENPSAMPFDGPVRLADAIGVDGLGRLAGVEVTGIDPPLACPPGALPLSCVAGVSLAGGASQSHKMKVVIPTGGGLAGVTAPVMAQNCFAAVPPDHQVSGLNGGGGPGGSSGGGPFACHRFTISFPQGGGCTLLPGQVKTKDGRCVCRKGSSLANGKCVAARQPACKVSGQVRGKNGVCACPRGTQSVNGVCRKPPRGCPAGTTAVRGRCVPNTGNGGCIAGELFVNGQCMIVEGCPSGTVGKFPNCRPARRTFHQPSNGSDRPDSPGRQGGGRDPTGGGGSTPGGPNGP
ncbi:EB domain-containing protein [Aminobacter sp. HY435]|uniref:EB domain-containing protein n=1 Tax=Aminobacter sp. HY435 TaxID=2970917 RepID=UPI0022B9BC24|nr:EB domain-containing protein [Aminobacter sp. HY435]